MELKNHFSVDIAQASELSRKHRIFPGALFPELMQKMPELTTRLVAMMSDRIREGTRIEQKRTRSASLGKLSAGLAHEVHWPWLPGNRPQHSEFRADHRQLGRYHFIQLTWRQHAKNRASFNSRMFCASITAMIARSTL
jgi:hypothetical protein